jgi:predicted DsbA family dithiol-disulfide isomerase
LLRYAQELDSGQESASAVAGAVYEAFFVSGRDIGDVDTLIAIGSEAGLEHSRLAEHLRSTRDEVEVQVEADRARELGVRGVPTYGREGRPVSSPPGVESLRAFLVALPEQPVRTGARAG